MPKMHTKVGNVMYWSYTGTLAVAPGDKDDLAKEVEAVVDDMLEGLVVGVVEAMEVGVSIMHW